MSRFRKRFWAWVYVATSTLVGVFTALHASGQEPAPSSDKKTGDDAPAAAAKTSAAKDATGKDDADKNNIQKTDEKTKTQAKRVEDFVFKTDAEWRKILTRLQYSVTRQKGTEPAFSGKYLTGHYSGTFLCICCDAEVFNAQNKFDSGTGWPSFDRPANARALTREMDYSGFEPRIEVNCRRCGAHLGHIFDDGPTVTGVRFCINSVAIKLSPAGGESVTGKTSARTASKARSKSRMKARTRSGAKAKTVKPSIESNDAPATPDGDRVGGKAKSSEPSTEKGG